MKYWKSFVVVLVMCQLSACGKTNEYEEARPKLTSSYQSTSPITQTIRNSSKEDMQTTETIQKQEALEHYLQQFKNQQIAIYIEELTSGRTYGINENNLMYGASIAKLPIIYYTQLQLLKGALSMEATFPYIEAVNDIPGAMVRGGTGIMQQMIQENNDYSISQLLQWTIRYSDNLASNMLGYYVADKNSGKFLETISSFYPQPLPVYSKEISAKTAGLFMKEIYQNKIGLSDFLQTEWQKEKIGHLDVDVYHKIGTNGEFNHDVGIVMTDKPYVISIMTEGFSNSEIETIVTEIDVLMKKE
ncbi:serine hydrolase [Vagococcus bubulae]|uniref:Beta-lactamase class A catalytic domain-containing protein n=1 Tax=Vagococcus bubulae TaxID=1977868 RepID=A0A429ZQ59_9ENTE|nr:serine hydrolase [Vagococcus bubulae]RST95844.1 hypothetical protein CBF36_01365 [Vagococcus bubulae]